MKIINFKLYDSSWNKFTETNSNTHPVSGATISIGKNKNGCVLAWHSNLSNSNWSGFYITDVQYIQLNASMEGDFNETKSIKESILAQ